MSFPTGKAGGGGGRGKGVAIVVVLCIIAAVGWGLSQLLAEDAFEVGQCVEITDRTLDSDLTATSCPADGMGLTGNVYEVAEVLDGTDASCYEANVEFTHEPHDKTYCLVYPGMDYG